MNSINDNTNSNLHSVQGTIIDVLSSDDNEEATHTAMNTDMLDVYKQELEQIEHTMQQLTRRRDEIEQWIASYHRQHGRSINDQEGDMLLQDDELAGIDWDNAEFTWSQQLRDLAQKHWGITKFRPAQWPVINAVMHDRDVLAIMPTGGGKSLCYQLPALLKPGVTLVISPLVALMHDQVFSLEQAQISAYALTASSTAEESRCVRDILVGGSGRNAQPQHTGSSTLIYVTPERIAKSKRFTNQLDKCYQSGRLVQLVIDECHCCSQLGHDYRPDYRKLDDVPKTPLLALSATCPPEVKNAVMDILQLKRKGPQATLCFQAPLERPNLRYHVQYKPKTMSDQITTMAEWIKREHPGQRGIIYCLSKKESQTIAKDWHNNINWPPEWKGKVHQSWRVGRILIVVATIAFGMGIDQPNVRFVLHHTPSKSLDAYYQETGRAGRDGQTADCVLYYHPKDATRLTTMVVADHHGIQNVYTMLKYTQDRVTCPILVSSTLSTLSSVATSRTRTCHACDNCLAVNYITQDITEALRDLCRLVDVVNEHPRTGVTLLKLAELWRGCGGKRVDIEQARSAQSIQLMGKQWNIEDCEHIILFALLNGYLKESFHFTAYSTISYIALTRQGSRLANGNHLPNEPISIVWCPTTKSKTKPTKLSLENTTTATATARPTKRSRQ
ncbi:P-loop containing nucleoside triphosphate hydrolase protein [Syncephalis plumigaleata]|nr:P-loop containing nucleoside triphosphate hydrolase protein [Syncephalis plumigaleata]